MNHIPQRPDRRTRWAVAVPLLVIVTWLIWSRPALAVSAPALASAESFAVLSGDGVTSRGTASIRGDVGIGPGYAAPAFAPGSVAGTIHSADSAWNVAHADLARAYEQLGASACNQNLQGGELGEATISPGTTCVPDGATMAGALTVDAGGDSEAVFVVRIPGTLATSPAAQVVLANGAQACNVHFRVTGSTLIGQGSALRGSLVTAASVSLGPSATVDGRVLSLSGGVALNGNTISPSGCAPSGGGLSPLAPSAANQPGGSASTGPLAGPAATGPAAPAPGPGDAGDGGAGPADAGSSGVPSGGSGDNTEEPPADGSFPPDLAARRDSIVRTGASDSKQLVAALAPLAQRGVSPEQIVQVGYGRFPVGGEASYTHDWWFPRFGPGWRLHEGTDIFAARGTPVRSPSEGSVRLRSGGLGGTTAYVIEPGGTYYYLAHLAGYAPGLVDGAKVTTGQVVGYVGDSGNAVGTPPHLHFEVHPGGGGPVDPKPVLDGFLAEALGRVPTLLATYDPLNPPPVLNQAPSGSLAPAPALPPAATASAENPAPPGGVPASTLWWVGVAAVLGLAFGKMRERPLVLATLSGTAVNQERTRPTVRSISRRIAAARRGETRAKGRQLRPGPGGGSRFATAGAAVGFPGGVRLGAADAPSRVLDEREPASSVGLRRSGLAGEVDFRRWLLDSLGPETDREAAASADRAAERQLAVWARDGFGWPVPRAARALVEDAIRMRSLEAAEAGAIRALCLAATAIQPVRAPAGSDHAFLITAATGALAASHVPTVVCCPDDDAARQMEQKMGVSTLTGLPVLGIDRLLQEVEGGSDPGFPPGTTVIVAHALDAPATRLARLAEHLAASGGGLRLVVNGPPVLTSGDTPRALPRAPGGYGPVLAMRR